MHWMSGCFSSRKGSLARGKRSDMIQPKYNIPFSPPDIGEGEIEAVASVLRSGWITTGPRTKQLEKNITEQLGSAGCICLNSQTACAELALRLLGIGAGDEVITSAYTYTASASVVCHVGAKLVLVDCRKDGFEMDYDALEAAITERTKAIIPVDIAGVPCDYDRIYEIVERCRPKFSPCGELQEKLGRIAVVADAAHAFGAEYHGRVVGQVADFTNFSFHAVKNLTTAEGGAMTWRHIDGIDDAEIYRRVQLMSLHGQSKDALEKSQLGAWEYDVVGTWYKCNMTDIAAAIGLVQLERYPEMLSRRREIIERYDAAFSSKGIDVLSHYTDEHVSSGHLYLTRVRGIGDAERREIIIKMAERGVNCNVHYKPLPLHTAYRAMGFDIKDYPNALACYENEITLPLNTKLTDDEVEYIIETYIKVVEEYTK